LPHVTARANERAVRVESFWDVRAHDAWDDPLMNDDPQKRTADLGGGPTGLPARRRVWSKPWPWYLLGLALLIGLRAATPAIERAFPALHHPAPGWVGLLMLVGVLGVFGYGTLRSLNFRRTRRRKWAAGSDRRDGGDSGCGGGGSGCSGGGDSGSGHGGCGGGSGCGGSGCGGGGN
jgi:hypothetical protein